MNLNKQESKLKQFIRAQKRIDELHDLIAKAPYIPIKKKIWVGHWRFFKVRDDILRSSIGNSVKLVVEACNTWVLGKKKESKSYENCYGSVYCKYVGETTVSKQCLRPLNQEQIDKLNFKPTFVRKWFDVEEKTRSYGSKNVIIYRYFPKIPPHMIEFAFKPAYITEEKSKIGDFESELAKLYIFMSQNHGWGYLNNRYRYEWDLSANKKSILNKIKNKEIEDYLEE